MNEYILYKAIWLNYVINCKNTQLSSIFVIKLKTFLFEVSSQYKPKQIQYNVFMFAGNWTRGHASLFYNVTYDIMGLFDVCHCGILFRLIF